MKPNKLYHFPIDNGVFWLVATALGLVILAAGGSNGQNSTTSESPAPESLPTVNSSTTMTTTTAINTASPTNSTTALALTTTPTSTSTCAPGQFQCDSPSAFGCIPNSWVCDGYPDCTSGSDEWYCKLPCQSNQFACKDNKTCVNSTWACDGESDCYDDSDEVGCVTQSDGCLINQFACNATFPNGSAQCIPDYYVCNGGVLGLGCTDNSDEWDCPCAPDEFKCANKNCIAGEKLCDENDDCGDNSDENSTMCTALCDVQNNQNHTCGNTTGCVDSNYTLCPNSTKCINLIWICDFYQDCKSNWDEEQNCTSKPTPPTRAPTTTAITTTNETTTTSPTTTTTTQNENTTTGSTTTALFTNATTTSLSTNGTTTALPANVTTTSLPVNNTKTCRPGYFTCNDDPTASACVPNFWVCDGWADCDDYSDEWYCNLPCKSDQFACSDGKSCVNSSWVCDGDPDCFDGSDEANCTTQADGCLANQFACNTTYSNGTSQCIPDFYVCDKSIGRDCTDKSDELNCPCATDEYKCGNGDCISNENVCDENDDCGDNSDENSTMCTALCDVANNQNYTCGNTTGCVDSNYTLCPNSTKCINLIWICDFYQDCKSNWDEEQNCTSKPTPPTRAPTTTATSPSTANLTSSTTPSQNTTTPISSSPSTQNATTATPANNGTTSPPRNRTTCPPTYFQCNDDPYNQLGCIPSSWVCDFWPDCNDGSDEWYCNLPCKSDQFACLDGKSCVDKAWVCDGDKDCFDGSDEANCTTQPDGCLVNQFECNTTHLNGTAQCLPNFYVCDKGLGRDCSDHSDEWNCPCDSDQFKCANGKCIPGSSVCDEINDCGDYSDENMASCAALCEAKNNQNYTCGNSTTCVHSDYMLCPGSTKCINRIWICDNYTDCASGWDEDNEIQHCPSLPTPPTPVPTTTPPTNNTSSSQVTTVTPSSPTTTANATATVTVTITTQTPTTTTPIDPGEEWRLLQLTYGIMQFPSDKNKDKQEL